MRERAKKGSSRTLEATAYHEAGHAIVAWKLGRLVRGISIKPDAETAGRTSHDSLLKGIQLDVDNSRRAPQRAEGEVMISLAGYLAQRKFNPRTHRHYHGETDRERALDIVWRLGGTSEQVSAYYRSLERETERLLDEPEVWGCVMRLAQELLRREKLSRKQARDFIKNTAKPLRVQSSVHDSQCLALARIKFGLQVAPKSSCHA